MSVVANVAVNVDSRDAVGKLRSVQAQAQQTEKAFSGLSAAVGKLAIAAAAIQGARFIFAKTAEIESQTRSLQVLTGSVQKAKQIIEELQQLGAVTPFTSTELIDSAKRLQAFGVEADKVVETTKRLADVSGATGAELQGLVTAYGQVQAKGRLQGEELLQFQERGVALQAELRKMYGLSGEEFQKALSKGQVSAQAVEVAIQRLTSAGGKYANGAIAQSDTLSGRLSTLQDGIDGLARVIGAALSPAIKAVLNEAIFAINTINSLIATGARAKGFGLGDAQRKTILDQAQKEAEQLVNLRRIKNPFERNRQFQEVAAQRERDLIEAYGIKTGQVKPTVKAPTAPTTLPPLLAPTGGGAGRAKGAGSATANKAAQIQAEIQGLQRQVALTQQLTFLDEQIANAEAEKDQQLVIRLQGEEKLLQLRYQLADELAKAETAGQRDAALAKATAEAERIRVGTAIELSKNEEERQQRYQDLLTGFEREIELSGIKDEAAKKLKQIEYDIVDLRKQGVLLTDSEIEAYRRRAQAAAAVEKKSPAQKRMDELKKSIADLTDIENIAVSSADMMGAAFGQAFQDIINGSASAQDALAGMMKSIGENFVNMAAQIIAQQITMIILGSIMKALGLTMGGGGGGSWSGDSNNFGNFSGGDFGIGSMDVSGLSGAGALSPSGFYGGGKISALFADGGFVTGPTQAIVGEGGQPEYIIPASKMQAAMTRYSAGARGDAVIPSDGGTSAAGGTATMAAPTGTIDIRYTVERINTVDYVTADQFQRGMAQAAQQGATQGEQRTLRRLQQSRTTRSRLGMA